MKLVAAFLDDSTGATAIEYGLIAALLSVSIITTSAFLGGGISNVFGYIGTQISTAVPN